MQKTITIESKIHNQGDLYGCLDEFGSFYCFLERTLFNELSNTTIINSDLRKNLKRQYIAKYQIHARLFNVIWNDVKGSIDSLKELDKINRKDLSQKVAKYQKKITQAERWLKRGFRKTKSNPLKPHEIVWLKQNLVQYKNVIHKLKNKLDKPFVPKMIFGGRKFYKSQWNDENYVQDHELWKSEWSRKRNGHFSFIGSKDETNGNQLCQYKNDKITITLPYCFERKHLEITVKFSSDDKTNKQYYNYFHDAYKNKQALSYKFIKRENDTWYVQVSFSINSESEHEFTETIGVDFNYNLIATTEIDRFGNFKRVQNYKFDSDNLSTDQSNDLMSKIVLDIVERAKQNNMSISIEKLDLKKCKQGNTKVTNKKVNLLQYGQFRDKLETKCIKEDVWLKQVNPAFTSIIGKYKYKNKYGMSVHNSAAMVIARRANNYKDKVPSQICRVLHSGGNEFFRIQSTCHHWKHWSYVNKNLEKSLKEFNSATDKFCGKNNLTSRFNPADYVVHPQVSNELTLVSFSNFN